MKVFSTLKAEMIALWIPSVYLVFMNVLVTSKSMFMFLSFLFFQKSKILLLLKIFSVIKYMLLSASFFEYLILILLVIFQTLHFRL